MSSRSQAVLSQNQALPPEKQEVYDQVVLELPAAEPAVAHADPIRSARGMFAGSGLCDALKKYRQEELA